MTVYFLGIDCGSTAIKAALFDQVGNEIKVANDRSVTQFPKPGYAETDIEDTWRKVSSLVSTVVDQSGVSPSLISAVGVSGHGNGLFALDVDGNSIKAIKSLDSRTDHLCEEVKRQDDYVKLRELNHQGVWPAQTAILLKWMKIHDRECYNRIATVFFCKDFINFKLTGARATEVGDLSASGLYDFSVSKVSTQLLEILGIPEMRGCIPPPRQSQDIIGCVNAEAAEQTGLMAGTPVIAGAFDVIANAIGSGVSRKGQASIVAGSWSINQVVCDSLPSSDLFMTCVFPGYQYLAMENSATSASNLEWFVKNYIQPSMENNMDVFEYCNRLIETLTVEENLPIFHPYLYGSKDSGSVGANFYGLRGWHGQAEMLYAIYEGIVFGHLEHLNVLEAYNIEFSDVALSGGGARSEVWSQLFANCTGRTLRITPCQEVGALGIAMLAATATNVYSDIDEAITHMSRVFVEFEPDKEVKSVLDKRYQRYQEISRYLNDA